MTNILKALEFVLSSLIIGSAVFFGLESGFHHQYSMSTVNPYAFEYSEIVELKQPESPEVIIPEIRLASFEDEFAVRPVVRNLTEEDWKLLESISLAEVWKPRCRGCRSCSGSWSSIGWKRQAKRQGRLSSPPVSSTQEGCTVGMNCLLKRES